ncbi:MAG: hypothetical protein U0892_06035 [Pirellulales bacterium]
MCICSSFGCNMFGGKQVQELRLENDRLLSEYRSQRDKLAALQETNAALESRLSESEKLLAKLGQPLPATRLSQADTGMRSAANPLGSLSTYGSSRNSGTGSMGNASLGGANGSYAPAQPGTSVDSNGLQWRPMRKP